MDVGACRRAEVHFQAGGVDFGRADGVDEPETALEADRLEIGQPELDTALLGEAEQGEQAAPVAAAEPALGSSERRAAGARAARPGGRSGPRPRPTS